MRTRLPTSLSVLTVPVLSGFDPFNGLATREKRVVLRDQLRITIKGSP